MHFKKTAQAHLGFSDLYPGFGHLANKVCGLQAGVKVQGSVKKVHRGHLSQKGLKHVFPLFFINSQKLKIGSDKSLN